VLPPGKIIGVHGAVPQNSLPTFSSVSTPRMAKMTAAMPWTSRLCTVTGNGRDSPLASDGFRAAQRAQHFGSASRPWPSLDNLID